MTTAAEVQRVVQAWAAGFDAAVLTATDAARAVDVAAEVEHLAAYVKMVAAERVAATSAWHGSGKKSPQDWLADRTGTSTNEAAETLKTARKLKRLPRTRRAMAKGRLSPAQAGAVADAADADPAAEAGLLDTAEKATLKNLREEARRVKAAATADDGQRDRRIHGRRSLRTYVDDDGAFNLHLRTTAAAGTRLLARMKPHQEQAFRQHRSDGSRDRYEARSHDAFFATLGLDPHGRPLAPAPGPAPSESGATLHPTQDGPGPASRHDDPQRATQAERRGPPRPRPEGDAPPRPDHGPSLPQPPPDPGTAPPGPVPVPVGGNNIKVIVRIDHTALVRGRAVAGETVEVAGLGPISVATARELMGDAFLAAVVTNGHDVCTVAHLGRSPNAYQRTALEAQHIACTNLGCNGSIGIQIDHRDPWAATHQTPTDGLDPLCPHCHRLKTHHGYQLEPGSGPRRLLAPDQLPGRTAVPSTSASTSVPAPAAPLPRPPTSTPDPAPPGARTLMSTPTSAPASDPATARAPGPRAVGPRWSRTRAAGEGAGREAESGPLVKRDGVWW